MDFIKEKLLSLAEQDYKDFSASLMPTINKETVLGVRVPILRKLAKDLIKTDNYKDFLNKLPHNYYEENNLHAFLIENQKDYNTVILLLNEFLPFVNNWATCDMMSPKVFKFNKPDLIKQIKVWIKSKDVYTVRFGIKCLMQHFLEDDFKEEYLELVANIKSNEYYINMMCAWFFQEALLKQYKSSIVYFENKMLSEFVHKKAISKANDSYRISRDIKEYLKTLKYN